MGGCFWGCETGNWIYVICIYIQRWQDMRSNKHKRQKLRKTIFTCVAPLSILIMCASECVYVHVCPCMCVCMCHCVFTKAGLQNIIQTTQTAEIY